MFCRSLGAVFRFRLGAVFCRSLGAVFCLSLGPVLLESWLSDFRCWRFCFVFDCFVLFFSFILFCLPVCLVGLVFSFVLSCLPEPWCYICVNLGAVFIC